jgi:RNA-directed DNA polymerase
VLAPCVDLKIVQRRIHHLISARFEPHPIAHAYARGRGIVTNARMHVGKAWLFHVDLVNFFGSIKESLVVELLRGALHDIRPEDVELIASLCCHEGALPQGSPCSPIISNLACFRLDQQLQELASELGVVVSRYSDDICFSSVNEDFAVQLATLEGRGSARLIAIGEPLGHLFEAAGFEVNWRKVRFQPRTERQQVTGVIVNKGLNVPREFYSQVRWSLSAWERHGLHVAARNRCPSLSKEQFANSLRGLIDHIGLVKGRQDGRYRELLGKYQKLRDRDMPRVRKEYLARAVDNVSKRRAASVSEL